MLEILINKNGNKKEIIVLENGRISEYYIDEENSRRKEGNIYIGVVRNIIKGMQAAFIDIGTERNSFIHLKDVLPKIDETVEKYDENVNINQLVKTGDKLLVQVRKDTNQQKGARVSTHINLPSKYIVLMPNTNIITVSQKVENKEEQKRLIKLVKENITEGNGAVIRTSAIGKDKEIIEDIKNIESKWKKIDKKYKTNIDNAPILLEKAENIVEKMIIDFPEKSVAKILVNDKKEYEKLMKIKEKNSYFKNINIEFTEENILNLYDIQNDISKIDNRKIWLKCGGFITIDKTEALTAIDVNTGKFTGTKAVEDTIYKVNEEATIEIAKQLRLKDIGGTIIIDYIDMHSDKNKKKIQELLENELKKDRSKTQVEGFTKLDLMEITRKHICSHKE